MLQEVLLVHLQDQEVAYRYFHNIRTVSSTLGYRSPW